ncbi:MAG: SBBP repeat-containing protein, partial [Bacteroidia bacterium]|nr:SBBP repeat-containing protein [Bacteroidia bacterium]
MKKLLLFIAIILSGLAVKSQAVLNVFEDWTSNAGSQNFFHKSITKTDGSGNVYVAGATVNGSGTYDILVAKYSNSGVQQWIQQYNGYGNYHDFATAVFVDGSGNVYITGTVTDSLLVQGSDIITMKYNSSGTLQWATRYNGSADYYDAGADIAVDGSGNVYITGSIHTSASYPFTDAIIIKYNSSGTQQWATVYNNTTYNKSEAGARIRLTSGGKAIISGVIQMTTNTYIYGVLEYNMSTGAQIGGAALGTGTSNISYLGDLTIDVNNGCAYIAGAVYDSVTTGYDYYLVKLDSTLAVIWERTYDGGSNLEDMANSVKVDGAGSVYVTGYTTNATQRKNITTRKYNSSGGLVWTQTYNDTLNGDDAAMSMAIDADANIYITGYDSTALGKTSNITIKYDRAGA